MDRREEILTFLAAHGLTSVHRLAKEMHASEATIRRDLTALEQEGRLHRTFGGAIPAEVLNREVPFIMREQKNIEKKRIIAKKAAELISNGITLFLDASSTVYHLIPYLEPFQDLTIITNSPKTSLALGARGIANFCAGGELLRDSVSYVGPQTSTFFQQFNADLLFFSCRGVNNNGVLCDSSLEESQLRKEILPYAAKKIFLCDSSKFGVSYRCNICRLDQVDQVICDQSELPQRFQNGLGTGSSPEF